jgi:hypothetical protein
MVFKRTHDPMLQRFTATGRLWRPAFIPVPGFDSFAKVTDVNQPLITRG